MKALSVRQPWAWLIVNGYKDVENRNWRIGRHSQHGFYRSQRADFSVKLPCRVYVHASKLDDPDAWSFIMITAPRDVYGRLVTVHATLPRGTLIGEVDIVDCVTQSGSPWFEGPYGFVLANPKAYDKPIPCKGKLGFFEPENIPEIMTKEA